MIRRAAEIHTHCPALSVRRPSGMGFNRCKMEDRRRQAAEKEAATRRATDAQVLEDVGRLVGRFVAAAVAGTCLAVWSVPAAAYRPFDGTDAAVADVGEVEIEFQPAGVLRAGAPKGLSDVVFNYGFADRWEVVLQTTPQVMPDGAGPLSVANAALLTYVVQPGVLQDKPGASIATEFGPLLPPADGSGLGFGWTGIVSQRWNTATNLTPDQHAELFFDAIIEGPSKWNVRPVFEIYSDSVFNQSQTFSAGGGARDHRGLHHPNGER